MTEPPVHVFGGVDTHKYTHHAAVIDSHGRLLSDHGFPTTASGHAELWAWIRSHGEVCAIGVEGTGFYGASLTRFLHDAGARVVEVNRPNRAARRTDGKSDRLDAEQAVLSMADNTVLSVSTARSMLSGSLRRTTSPGVRRCRGGASRYLARSPLGRSGIPPDGVACAALARPGQGVARQARPPSFRLPAVVPGGIARGV